MNDNNQIHKKDIAIFTLYSEKGASSQYRAYIFKDELEKSFNVKWFYFWNDKYVTKYIHNKKKYAFHILVLYLIASIKRFYQLFFIAPNVDVVFLQKGIIPKCKFIFLNRLKKKNVRIIFDVDDAIYTIPKDNSSSIAKMSDLVICGNNTLMDYYMKYNKNCVILPTVENTLNYEKYWSNTFNSKIIGWIGSKTTIDNFDLIIDALNSVISKDPNVKVAIISNTALDYTSRIKNSYLVEWRSDTYIKELGKITIGIMPLKDNDTNRGKCGFKLIQYLNMKKPVIGSNVGVNADIISNYGVIADTQEEWQNAIELLLYNKSAYDNYIRNIENDFFNTYHFELVAKKLVDYINE